MAAWKKRRWLCGQFQRGTGGGATLPLGEGGTHPTEAPELAPGTSLGKVHSRAGQTSPLKMDGGEKRPTFAGPAREGSADAASFAPPLLRETIFGQREKDGVVSCTSADLPAPEWRDSPIALLRWTCLSRVSWLASIEPPFLSVECGHRAKRGTANCLTRLSWTHRI